MHELCSRHIVAYYATLTFALPNVSAFKEPPLDLKNGTHAYTEVFITRKYLAHALGFFFSQKQSSAKQIKNKTEQNKTEREREREHNNYGLRNLSRSTRPSNEVHVFVRSVSPFCCQRIWVVGTILSQASLAERVSEPETSTVCYSASPEHV